MHLDIDKEPMTRSTSLPMQRSKSEGSENNATDQAPTSEPKHEATKRYAKTLRLTSDQLVCALAWRYLDVARCEVAVCAHL